MDLICPKCQATMRNYERNGVNVDQCSECRGIFLDRGELEQIMDAEQKWNTDAAGPADPAPDQAGQSPQSAGALGAIIGEVMQQARGHKGYDKHAGYDKHGYDKHGYDGHRGRKRESFLGDLFG